MRSAAGRPAPVRTGRTIGMPTRGTTSPNRLRRVDRWLVASYGVGLSRIDRPVVVDLGFGASPVTTVELATRLWQRISQNLSVVGVEIDAQRVAAAQYATEPERLSFEIGGFELAGHRPNVVRAFNVLRQYPPADAAAAWLTMTARLAPGGVLVEGTSSEIGRRASWVLLTEAGPQSLTLACDTDDIVTPSELAERLPKALIHHNVPGQPIHQLLREFDAAWAMAAPLRTFSSRQRWVAAAELLDRAGWSVPGGQKRWRYGEFTVPWSRVAPV